jgi:hypothetical protein
MAGRRQQLQWHGGWLVEDEQEGAAEDEAVVLVLEEDLSDEEADSAGPVKWVIPAWLATLVGSTGSGQRGVEGTRSAISTSLVPAVSGHGLAAWPLDNGGQAVGSWASS